MTRTDEQLAMDTLKKLPYTERYQIIEKATTLGIKCNISTREAIVVLMKLGQYFTKKAGVKYVKRID